MEVHAVDHCNLNCAACSHFCPLAPKKFCSPEGLARDCNELGKKISLRRFRILGGEPLLHPQISQLIAVARQGLPEVHLGLCTNGILLPRMGEEFWRTCRENSCSIEISFYPPLHENCKRCEELAHFHHVPLSFDHGRVRDGFARVLDPLGRSSPRIISRRCYNAGCALLREGRIYRCPTAYCMVWYNAKFGQNIPQDPGLDLYANPGRRLVAHLRRPCATCRHCTIALDLHPWAPSTGKAEEWIAAWHRNRDPEDQTPQIRPGGQGSGAGHVPFANSPSPECRGADGWER
jgi:hypothetical protein